MSDDVIELRVEHIDPTPPPRFIVRFRDGSERSFQDKIVMEDEDFWEVVSITETKIEPSPNCKLSVGST
jgi:hypothetical protein